MQRSRRSQWRPQERSRNRTSAPLVASVFYSAEAVRWDALDVQANAWQAELLQFICHVDRFPPACLPIGTKLLFFSLKMSNLKHLPIGTSAPDVVHAIIEIPKGSRNKIEYDEELEAFKLDRVLFSAVHYPVAYGFIPSTHWDDGDPLDILVITNEPLATGIVLDVIDRKSTRLNSS